MQGDKMLLPLILEGRDAERSNLRHSGWIFGRAMRERMRTEPVRQRKTMSFPTARIIQIRAGGSCTGTIKNLSVLYNVFNCATLNQLCIQAHSSSLRCGGSLCKVQSDTFGVINCTLQLFPHRERKHKSFSVHSFTRS